MVYVRIISVEALKLLAHHPITDLFSAHLIKKLVHSMCVCPLSFVYVPRQFLCFH